MKVKSGEGEYLSVEERELLARVERNLPLLADLLRADLLLYCRPTPQDAPMVVAEAKPHTVPSLFEESLLGKKATHPEELAVTICSLRGKPLQRFNHVLVRGAPTVQEVYPVKSGHRVIAVLRVETGLLERERQRKKSVVYRRAVAQVRDMVLRGQLEGGDTISPLGEHDGPLVVNNHQQILYISSIAEHHYRKLGYTRSLLRSKITDLRTDESVVLHAAESGACAEQTVQEKHLTWVKKAIPLVAKQRPGLWRYFVPNQGEIDGAIVVIHDITDQRQKEQELKTKSAMIQEIHHRVKNNLQTIAALLRLQARRTGSLEAAEILRQTINRILSIAVVHESLAYDESSIINVKEICQRIVNEVAQSILDPEKRISFAIQGADIYLPAQQATSCALIINELLQNAVKHGYASRGEGTIAISLQDTGDQLSVEIADDGQGLSPDFRVGREGSLGLQIVRTLVREDLKGSFELHNGRGVRAVVTFPKLPRLVSP